MTRRRSTPWIHRWSRILIAAIAVLGILDTTYLTLVEWGVVKEALCPTSGAINCEAVLRSEYAKVFGIPLSVFGFLAYAGMGALAIAPLPLNPQEQKGLRSQVEKWTWLGLFAGGTAMLFFSGYLFYLMAFEIKAFCLYCLASTIFSIALFVIILLGHTWEDLGQLFFIGIVVGMIALIGTLGVYASAKAPAGSGDVTADGGGQVGFPIKNTSGPAEIALARYLKEAGAKEYGAYWCPHCHEQKELFGKEAAAELDYVECDPKGKNPRPQLCQSAGIKGYPTWEINGQFYEGVQDLNKLADLTGYKGPRNFKNLLPGR
ncbi:vitamin K epoxide reductase family protein [Planktothrix sp. FACHB-1355]|uniref:Vitamin K epoxide reductase family protein n=1 Tax=Aerosakkonema funiforme FACHB-1375 TaxID=2949571 RepID=A0A926VH14_9CYAN|nr:MULTISPECIES: vitamin K epoxide reductase family protein [Oscillatoriales]MBD2183662.1 vitamin K epoxide reductase family protein [Aerosakkonema funiforme FACHB-1375]MBD3561884.1 vitamin K epoxide reductase family protein [Planktothrix sp. FACHB-1355]